MNADVSKLQQGGAASEKVTAEHERVLAALAEKDEALKTCALLIEGVRSIHLLMVSRARADLARQVDEVLVVRKELALLKNDRNEREKELARERERANEKVRELERVRRAQAVRAEEGAEHRYDVEVDTELPAEEKQKHKEEGEGAHELLTRANVELVEQVKALKADLEREERDRNDLSKTIDEVRHRIVLIRGDANG